MVENSPKFISTFPLGEDKLPGSSHSNIAKTICNIISNNPDDIKKKIIGLEGNWGSGKSNIIKIIQKKEKGFLGDENHIHFIFDAWAHQEDLNRRALLEELIDDLESKDLIPKNEEWKRNKNSLKGKTVNSIKSVFPQIKIFWILYICSFISYRFLDRIFPYFKEIDFIPNYSFDNVNKEVVLIWMLPFILFFIGTYFLIKEIIKVYDDKKSNLTFEQSIGQVFHIINGKEVKTNTTDFIIEDEPSNKQFRYFFGNINKVLEHKNKVLILTIDNIDRLSKEKVKALWSTINIFFAENTNESYNNVWLIIPYDESKVIKSFKDENDDEIGKGLIDKTFAIKFRVTPPLLSNWEDLLVNYLKDAFGNEIIENNEEIHFIKRIFDNYISDYNIKPRQIVNYINDIVTLKIQFPETKLRYLALFSMAKSKILNDSDDIPSSQKILDNSYLTPNTKLLFNNDSDLYKHMASLTFGVSINDAEEIVYDREIYLILKEGKIDNLEKFNNLPTFPSIFEKKFTDLTFSGIEDDNIDKIPDILLKIEELNINSQLINEKYWQSLVQKIISHDYLNKILREIHKKIVLKDISLGKRILQNIINEMFREVSSEEAEINYIKKIWTIKNFLIEEKIDIEFNNFKFYSRSINPTAYLKLLNKFPDDFDGINLKCEKLIDYFYSDKKVVEIDLIFNHIKELELINKNDIFSSLIENIQEQFKHVIKIGQFRELHKYHAILKKISKKENFLEDINIPLATINSEITNIENNKSNELINQFILFSFKYHNMLTPESYPNIFDKFKNFDDELIQELSENIEDFITYHDLIRFAINNSNVEIPLIKKIIINITKNDDLGYRLGILDILSDLNKINEIIFENDNELKETFFMKLSDWHNFFEADIESDINSIEKISNTAIEFAVKYNSRLSNLIIENINKYLLSKSKKDYFEIYERKEGFIFNSFKLLKKDKLKEEVLNNYYYPFFKQYLKEFASGVNDISTVSNFQAQSIIKEINESDKKLLFSDINRILNNNKNLSSKQVSFFAKYLFQYNTLFDNPDDSVNGVFKNFINNEYLYNKFFKSNYRIFIDLINKSRKNKLDGKKILRTRLKYYPKNSEIRKYANRKVPGWNKI